ncbi:MAG: AAA family ATPase [Acetobacteraceae bacterium]|nr:AAA family ATPase [Acetobacteraceae bacterium]
MTVPPEQQSTAAFLSALSGAAPIETHISLVYVGADTVWKLRKAVRLSFLDLTGSGARRQFAYRELELNARAAPGLYRGVLAVLKLPDGGLALGREGAGGEAIDWVVRMARVPAEHFLERIALSGSLSPALLDAVADSVAAYHLALPPSRGVDPADAMRLVALGNATAALEAGLPSDSVREWLDAAMRRIDASAAWLEERGREGFVRRGHGDLHLGNMCLWQGRPVLFDALEFDEALATIDVGYDLAFLLMDVDHRVGRPQANRVLNRYIARTADAALTRGLPVFLSLRAMVRAHVEAKRGRTSLAGTYLRDAQDYLQPKPALVVAVGGLQATGKSTLARALASELGPAPGALVLRSDEIRKRRHGLAPEQPLAAEAYTEESHAAVMEALFADAVTTARGGHAVVADATFLDHAHRVRIEQAAVKAGAPFVGLWLEAPLPVLEARLRERQGDASDATLEVLHRALATAKEVSGWARIDAGTPGAALAGARQAVRARVEA